MVWALWPRLLLSLRSLPRLGEQRQTVASTDLDRARLTLAW